MRSPSRHLLKSSFQRLFENDLVPDDFDSSDVLAWVVPLFAAPATFLAMLLLPKYAVLQYVSPDQLQMASWPDKLFFIGYSMAAVGLVTLLVWEAIYPDERDAVVIGSLPVRRGTFLVSKAAALCGLTAGFALAINLLPALTYAFAAGGNSPSLTLMPRILFAHLVSVLAASGFVVFTLIGVQTLLCLLLTQRVLRTVSALVQLLFVVLLLEWMFFSPRLLERMGRDLPVLSFSELGRVTLLPPLWFLGLYESLVGGEPGGPRELAGRAMTALLTSFAVAAAGYAASSGLVWRRLLERSETVTRPATASLQRPLLALLMRHPIERAVFDFVAKSLVRSRRHRLLIAAYLGVGVAFVIGSFLGPFLDGRGFDPSHPSVPLLSIPLVLSFFTLVAMRVLFTLPTELEANWIFRMTESADKRAYAAGVRKAMLLLGLGPILLLSFPLYTLAWGAGTAAVHSLFWLLLGGSLAELLLVGFDRVPFTCSYVPGKSNVKLLWPAYLLVMLVYTYLSARIEMRLLPEPTRLLSVCTLLFVGLALVAGVRRFYRGGSAPFRYDEAMEPTVQRLDLIR